ncbi:MAG: 5-aminolevulic acid synthase [Gemmobacter sp.]|nr:5-aminolevulic acid synthase [Gemmobacter sp.]
MTRRFSLLFMAMICGGTAASAEPVTGAAAGKLLFPPKAAAVEMLPQDALSDTDVAALKMVGGGQPYYGAIAISPSEGLMVEATVAAVNHHNADAAKAAALKGCEEKRKGAKACAVVAVITPEGWSARDLQLSADATAAFAEHYAAPGALAVSPGTGNFGIAKGEGAGDAAVAACEEKAKAGDCAVVILD